MNKNMVSKLWFFAAMCFMIVGIMDKEKVYIILACSYICLGCASLGKKNKVEKDIKNS